MRDVREIRGIAQRCGIEADQKRFRRAGNDGKYRAFLGEQRFIRSAYFDRLERGKRKIVRYGDKISVVENVRRSCFRAECDGEYGRFARLGKDERFGFAVVERIGNRRGGTVDGAFRAFAFHDRTALQGIDVTIEIDEEFRRCAFARRRREFRNGVGGRFCHGFVDKFRFRVRIYKIGVRYVDRAENIGGDHFIHFPRFAGTQAIGKIFVCGSVVWKKGVERRARSRVICAVNARNADERFSVFRRKFGDRSDFRAVGGRCGKIVYGKRAVGVACGDTCRFSVGGDIFRVIRSDMQRFRRAICSRCGGKNVQTRIAVRFFARIERDERIARKHAIGGGGKPAVGRGGRRNFVRGEITCFRIELFYGLSAYDVNHAVVRRRDGRTVFRDFFGRSVGTCIAAGVQIFRRIRIIAIIAVERDGLYGGRRRRSGRIKFFRVPRIIRAA